MKISEIITTENVALFSVLISLMIFVISKFDEIRFKKYEEKKTQYLKLIKLLSQAAKPENFDVNGEFKLNEKIREEFWDAGSSLLIYGSKKLYKKYIFYRMFASDPQIRECKYYKEELSIYIVADIFRTIRKEIGLSFFNNVSCNEALGFYVNDVIYNPEFVKKESEAMRCLKLIKIELFIMRVKRFVHIDKLFQSTVLCVWDVLGML